MDTFVDWFVRLPLAHIWICTVGACVTFWYVALTVACQLDDLLC